MRLLVSHHSVLSIYKHAGGRLLTLFIIVVHLARRQTRTVQASEAVMFGKILYGYRFQVVFKNPHGRNTFQRPHKQLLRSDFYITGIHFILQYPLAADDGSRKKQHKPRTPNR